MRLLESDTPVFLLKYIAGAVIAGAGAVGTTVYQWLVAAPDPHDLSMQPLHVILISFIVALALFIGMILRAVWTRLMPALNKFSSSINNLTREVRELNETMTKKTEHFDQIALSALRSKVQARPYRHTHEGGDDYGNHDPENDRG